MSDWEASSDEEAPRPPPPFCAVDAAPLRQPPAPARGSEGGAGGRRSSEAAAAARAGGGEWEPRGAWSSRGPGRWRLQGAASGRPRAGSAPLCFFISNAQVRALIGNNGRTPAPGGLGQPGRWVGRGEGPAEGFGGVGSPQCRCLPSPPDEKGHTTLRPLASVLHGLNGRLVWGKG